MKAFCVWYSVHVYLSIEPVTLGSYITSQLITMEAFLDRVETMEAY